MKAKLKVIDSWEFEDNLELPLNIVQPVVKKW